MATGQQVSNVRVALAGNVWVASANTAAPTDISVAPSTPTWTDLGYTTEDGVTISIEQTTEDIMGWQALEPLRTIVTAEPKSFNFTLRQLQRATFVTAFGGSMTDQTGGKWKWTPPTAGVQTSKAYLLEFQDDTSHKYRFWYGNCAQQGAREINFVRSDAVNLPLEYKVLAGTGNTWEMYTNDDSAFNATG